MKRNKKVRKLNPKVLGLLEKVWGALPCNHGHEGVTPIVRIPDIKEVIESKTNTEE